MLGLGLQSFTGTFILSEPRARATPSFVRILLKKAKIEGPPLPLFIRYEIYEKRAEWVPRTHLSH